ncbi:glucose-dependent insulinotropic receptor-like [Dysidea avara]|uniref:glucose-dependent insulinotropic receptor-like n=1 Tax=Dysidea avara TaxID=196820 RepID=UPI00332346AA
MSFVIIAADKVVAIRFPFKHKRMMTSRVVAVVISGAWLIAIIPTAYTITFDVDGVTDVPQYGACLFEGNAFVEAVVIFIIPMVVASILTILLNVRLAIKAFQVHRLIERETRLAGVNSQSTNLSVLRKKLCTIKRNRKPIITLFVVIFGSVSIPLLFTPFLILGRFLVGSQVYLEFTEYVMVPNIGFVIRFFQPLVYGLYFKQVREQMMRCLKRLNKVNSVAPQP